MSVGYVYDLIYLEHDVPGHPESPGRLRAIMSHLESSGLLGRMVEVPPRDATVEELCRVHAAALVEQVRTAADPYRDHWLDVDTYVVGTSYEAALRSAGGVMAATDACWTKWTQRCPGPAAGPPRDAHPCNGFLPV
jgi:acetoin utilization deacetylase AcuC-like enzyme